MHKALAVLCLVVVCLSAHAKTAKVTIPWKAPLPAAGWTGCVATAPCSYVVSRAYISGGACPVTTARLYTPLNSGNPTTLLSYTDIVPFNSSMCYIVQTLQTVNGKVYVSVPSAPLRFIKVH